MEKSALQLSEEKYRRLVEGLAATHCVFSHTTDGYFLYAGPGFKTVFGYEPAEIIGHNWRELNFTQESMAEGNLADEAIASEGRFQAIELTYNHPDGSRRMIKIVYGPVYDNDKIVAMEGVCEDITESRQIKDSLQKSEERYRSIVEVLNAGVWEYHHETGYLWCSREYYDMLGYEPGELCNVDRPNIKSCWIELIHPDDIEAATRHFFDYLAGGSAGLYENRFRLRHKNGSYLAIWSRGKILCDKDGKRSGVALGIHIDVSEQTRAEEALRESEQKHREIFNATSDAIFIHDAHTGKIIDVNKPALKMYGFATKEQMLADDIVDLSADSEPYTRENAINRVKAAANGEVQPFEWQARKCNGEIFPVEVVLSPSLIRGQERVIAVLRDISQQKKLLQSAQRADKLESLGILAGGIAHDFNNLLGGIYGFLELARSSAISPETEKYLDACLRTMTRARGLTQQLLTFAGGGKPDCKIQALFPFVEETARFALSGSNVSCQFEVADDLAASDYDRSQLGQVIENIVINAVQSMPEGGNIILKAMNRELADRQHPLITAGKYVQISVSDHGCGIDREILPQIFDPFFSTKPGGHGLGLATSYSIIKSHGGHIDVNSETGYGSTFHIFLPAVSRSLVCEESEEDVKHYGHGMILVMDDEPAIRKIMSKNLEACGYIVVTAGSGDEVLKMLKDGVIDFARVSALLFDLTIPGGMGGKATITELRKLGIETPAFVMSGYSEDQVMTNPQQHGFSASIHKPFTAEELMKMLNRHLKS